MKKTKLLFLAALLFTVFSCGSGAEKQAEESASEEAATEAVIEAEPMERTAAGDAPEDPGLREKVTPAPKRVAVEQAEEKQEPQLQLEKKEEPELQLQKPD